jgi:iron-sulfur cluster assembly accessory protein
MQLTITEKAAEELQKAIQSESQATVAGIRLGIFEDGCCGAQYSLSLAETVEPSEAVAESQGIRVFIPTDKADALEGTIIDYVNTPMGSGFHISRTGGVEAEGGHGHGHGHGHGGGHGGCGCGSGGGGCGSGGCAC